MLTNRRQSVAPVTTNVDGNIAIIDDKKMPGDQRQSSLSLKSKGVNELTPQNFVSEVK